MSNHKTVACLICGQDKPITDTLPAETVRPPMLDMVKKSCSNWDSSGYVCLADLRKLRMEYIDETLRKETEELKNLTTDVDKARRESEAVSKQVRSDFDSTDTFGEKIADKIAKFGGSWAFIILFFVVLISWIVLNAVILAAKPFDPYPFILLNLVLSCIAAMQAPVIMMSQNRADAKDRNEADEDFKTNLKAEIEILALHDKLDYLLMHQWQKLLEIQQIQMEMMEQLMSRWSEDNGKSDDDSDLKHQA